MPIARLLLLSFLLSLTALRLSTSEEVMVPFPLPINLLMPRSGSAGQLHGISCLSWRLAVETNNLRSWKTIPKECEKYVGHYMLGDRYREDSSVVVDAALEYAKNLTLGNDGKDLWVFDVDETTLSNLPYYARHGFGAEVFNGTSFDAWVDTGKAPALPESLRLFRGLQTLGIKPVFLTARTEARRATTEYNLKKAGYSGWERVLLKPVDYHGTSVAFKTGERKKLVEQNGCRIVGNIGDQWSDIMGSPEGARTFKLPDPMYYIG